MQLDRALAQLSEIHAQVLRSEVYRGYRARPCLWTAAIAVIAALLQERLLPAADGAAYARYWSAVGLIGVALPAFDLWSGRIARHESWRRTLTVAGQLVPALAVGAALPWLLLRHGDAAIAWLPGLWVTLFGLGLFASLPYLPRAVLWVATFYLCAGALLLLDARPGLPSPWSVGLPFALGQLAAAGVLWTSLERRDGR
jgi:hypothetical protein